MARIYSWIAFFAGVLALFGGLYILLAASGVFGDPEMKLRGDPLIGGLFSYMLDNDVEIMGRTMSGEWERTLLLLKVISVIPIIIGAILAWVGLSTLRSRDDWRRR